MICSTCHRDASDHPAAYYGVGEERPVWKCWPCLTSAEKVARMPDARTSPERIFRAEHKTIVESP